MNIPPALGHRDIVYLRSRRSQPQTHIPLRIRTPIHTHSNAVQCSPLSSQPTSKDHRVARTSSQLHRLAVFLLYLTYIQQPLKNPRTFPPQQIDMIRDPPSSPSSSWLSPGHPARDASALLQVLHRHATEWVTYAMTEVAHVRARRHSTHPLPFET